MLTITLRCPPRRHTPLSPSPSPFPHLVPYGQIITDVVTLAEREDRAPVPVYAANPDIVYASDFTGSSRLTCGAFVAALKGLYTELTGKQVRAAASAPSSLPLQVTSDVRYGRARYGADHPLGPHPSLPNVSYSVC